MEIHHVGIATDEVTTVADLFASLLDGARVHRETFSGLDIVFVDVGGTYVEFLEPVSNEGTIAQYLDAQGPGIHHVAFQTPDIDGALHRAEELGIGLIDETPRRGAWGHQVAFLEPSDTGGVLVEFVEH